jgi:protein-disulfide isomerase
MLSTHKFLAGCALLAALTATACGSSSSSSAGGASASGTSSAASSSPAATGSSTGSKGTPGALSADARSVATGDIPDNQVFLVFQDKSAGYAMKYPEGWTQIGAGHSVTFKDKNNLVHVTVTRGPAPSPARAAAQLRALKHADPTLAFSPPQTVPIGSASAVKVVYSTQSAANPVTGKRVLLLVDRYELAHAGKVAIVDLGTPKGVDNVDAYRMMIHSFSWR